MFAIFKREVRSCFHGMIGYVLTAFLLVASAIYFVALNLGYGLPDFGYYTLYNTIFMLLFYFPVLTMRSFAEERRTRTDQLLLSLDGLNGFDGDMVITLIDVAEELDQKGIPQKIIGIRNIMDKKEIKEKLDSALQG